MLKRHAQIRHDLLLYYMCSWNYVYYFVILWLVSRESAKKHWQKFMGAQNEEEAFGIIKARKYKQIGVKASLVHAQCIRNQLYRVLEGTNETKWGGTTR